ncbi:MAG TPA: VWA-like domain-containing protein [Myxococcota bacterium]|nr:VWA-like domain-containing protein [Myxococcota bacterium]
MTIEARLTKALCRFITTYPYYVPIMQMARIQLSDDVPTMGLTIRTDIIYLLVGRTFAERCSDDELVGVLHHEINHIVLDHLYFDPAAYPDRRARMIAEEVTANEAIPEGEPLPGEPVTLCQFPMLPSDEDTHVRYERLEGLPGPEPGRGGGGEGGQGDPSRTQCDCSQRPSMKESMRQELLRRMAQGFDPARVKRALGKPGCGDEAAKNLIRLQKVVREPKNWRSILKPYARRQKPRSVLHRPNRRFPELVGIIPGRTRERQAKVRVLAAIDTSGSMDGDSLSVVNREVSEMSRFAKVMVVECDERIQHIHNWAGPLDAVHGGGGTDLRPPLSPKLLAEHRPDIIVYFTDGQANSKVPRNKPGTAPVIWCLTPGGIRPASWGTIVNL